MWDSQPTINDTPENYPPQIQRKEMMTNIREMKIISLILPALEI